MLEHKGFRKLAFTGSTEVGRNVAAAAADKLIPATLELGGKSANIFFEDCNWEQAMDGLQMGILFNQGQVCCAGSRVFVQESIYDRFVEDAVKRFNQVKVGLPWEADTQMGSQINKGQMHKILRYVELAKEEGAKVLCGGVQDTDGELADGCFLRPTLLGDVDNHMRVAQEEIFGPVACVIKFKTEDEVIAMANDSEYGLGGRGLDQRYQPGHPGGQRRRDRAHVGQHLQLHPRGRSLRRLQDLRHRPGDPQGDPGPLYTDEEYYD